MNDAELTGKIIANQGKGLFDNSRLSFLLGKQKNNND